MSTLGRLPPLCAAEFAALADEGHRSLQESSTLRSLGAMIRDKPCAAASGTQRRDVVGKLKLRRDAILADLRSLVHSNAPELCAWERELGGGTWKEGRSGGSTACVQRAITVCVHSAPS